VNAPNIISLCRLLSVPLTVWLIVSDQFTAAFALFVLAGLSDAVDGLLAKRFDMASELGGFLDPLADKALLVGVYVTLGLHDALPAWLVILVVSRDMLIVGGVLLAFAMEVDTTIQPLWISKFNTVAQILLAGSALARPTVVAIPDAAMMAMILTVGATTLASGAAYVVTWARQQDGVGGSS
jgi:cardiolipin synthase (CMP-forming)